LRQQSLKLRNTSLNYATIIVTRCTASTTDFFSDLEPTYVYLNQEENYHEASQYLKIHHANDAIWLNEGTSHKLARRSDIRFITELKWLKGNEIFYGARYDIPSKGIFYARRSLERLEKLVSACGSFRVVEDTEVILKEEGVGDHGGNVLGMIRELKESGSANLRDLVTIVERRQFRLHKIILAVVSSDFRVLTTETLLDSTAGILNLD